MRRFLFAVIQIRAGECLLHADHIVVNRLAAADVAYFHMVGALCLDDFSNLFGVLVAQSQPEMMVTKLESFLHMPRARR